MVNEIPADLLCDFARKYVWWKPVESAVRFPDRVLAQVMELGTFEDVLRMEELIGKVRLADVISHSEPGWFSPRSWHFWHYRLGLAKLGGVPPLPERVMG